jgi:hypothetical protein
LEATLSVNRGLPIIRASGRISLELL